MLELFGKSLITLLIICALLYVALRALQYLTKSGKYNLSFLKSNNILQLNSCLYIDSGAKIVNFSCKNRSYILLLGKNNDIIIDCYDNKDH
ncbi:MAG: hypothetical protein EB127_14340 [Alphaproteobacteria bacterium]|nr:hypothetical protein [Alphaproteobacteria bacterium]